MSLAPLTRVRIANVSFRCTARTAAHLRWTIRQLERRHPGAKLVILQPCYNTGVDASAGTHDFDAVLDVQIIGLDWWEAQWFLRTCGWAAWFRHTGIWADRDAWHIHMVSLPPGLSSNPTPEQVGQAYVAMGLQVGEYIDGGFTTRGHVTSTSQVDDYYAHSIGLKGQHRAGLDGSRFPRDINATVFKEDDMGYLDWSDADKKALAADIRQAVWDAPIANLDDGTPTKQRPARGVLALVFNKVRRS